jgi:ZIP family zinc transporter
MLTAVVWGGVAAASLLTGCALASPGMFFWMPAATGHCAQAFAAGAMLTMLADAMMPEAFEYGGKAVGFFMVVGFLLVAVLSIVQ